MECNVINQLIYMELLQVTYCSSQRTCCRVFTARC